MKNRRFDYILTLILVGLLCFMLGASTSTRGRFSWMMNSRATVTQFELNGLEADVAMLRASMDAQDGMMTPFVHRLSPDGQHIVVRVIVYPPDLPKDFDERRRRFEARGAMGVVEASSSFGIKDIAQAKKDIEVEFIDITAKSDAPTVIAEYTDGRLTIH